ncbi:family 10 glycosylhydrolase [Leptolyngbya sp. AN02str]|uniref:family 10 glycosylhydrolase n=1 Tax=Leptolyngbya sp. AN02str TaxID=3423363 RepID=UPI003D31B23A
MPGWRGAIAQESPLVPPPMRPTQEIRGVWITTNDMGILRDLPQTQNTMARLSQLQFNTVYPVVWNSGYVLYPSEVAQRYGIQPFVWRGLQGQDILQTAIATAHQNGLLAIPWFEFGFMAPPLSELTIEHPDWFTHRRDGSDTTMSAAGEVRWMNPLHPEVQQFFTSLVMEVVNRYDIDGIQFDDHTSLPVEFGYDDYTVALYQQETKQPPPANPRDPAWMRWRADKLTEFMTRLNHQVKSRKPHIIFSVSPNPYTTAYNGFLQDWLTWVRTGIVDELLVQMYRSDIYSFMEQVNRPEIQEARQLIPTAAGILTGLRRRPVPMSLVQAKVQGARSRGLGMAFFSFESLWNDAPEPAEERQAMFEIMFQRVAVRSRLAATPRPPTPPPTPDPLLLPTGI